MRAIKETFNLAFAIYKQTFMRIWYVSLFSSLISATALFLNYIAVGASKNAISLVNSLSIVLSLIAVYASGLMIYRMDALFKQKAETLWRMLKFVMKRYFLMASAMLIAFALIFSGLLLFVFPGIYLFVILVFIQPLILIDNKGFFASFKESIKMSWGKWWETFIIVLPFMLFQYVSLAGGYFFNRSHLWYFFGTGIFITAIFLYPLFYACILAQFRRLHNNKNTGFTSL